RRSHAKTPRREGGILQGKSNRFRAKRHSTEWAKQMTQIHTEKRSYLLIGKGLLLLESRAAGTLDCGKPLAAFSSRSLLRRYRTERFASRAGFTESANRLAQSTDGFAVGRVGPADL
ncbi:MAG: hypothetical protein JJT75_10375, partial [Opitutales bacterium]|nr:hypothetical protein [Opitutales bacterium]